MSSFYVDLTRFITMYMLVKGIKRKRNIHAWCI